MNKRVIIEIIGSSGEDAVSKLHEVVENPDQYEAIKTSTGNGEVTVTYEKKV
ncbi:MAG: hypothetical protein AAGF07_02655 [Patescibacteria group bacterium]